MVRMQALETSYSESSPPSDRQKTVSGAEAVVLGSRHWAPAGPRTGSGLTSMLSGRTIAQTGQKLPRSDPPHGTSLTAAPH